MPARLTLFLPQAPAKVTLLEEGQEYVLGRQPECDVQIDDDRISRRHARLRFTAGHWTITDLGSKNGVQVDGTMVEETAELKRESWLAIGGVLGRFELISEEVGRATRDRRLRQWQDSIELRRRLDPAQGLSPLLREVLASVLQLAAAERGFVLLARDDGDLEVAAVSGVEAEELFSSEFSGSVGAVERVLASGQAVASSDALEDTRLGERPSIVAQRIRAMVCLPLIAQDRMIGAIYADSPEAGKTFTELDVSILEAISSHAALAIWVARLDSELKSLVETLRETPVADAGEAAQLVERIESAWERSLTSYGDVAPEGPATVEIGATWSGLLAAHRGVKPNR